MIVYRAIARQFRLPFWKPFYIALRNLVCCCGVGDKMKLSEFFTQHFATGVEITNEGGHHSSSVSVIATEIDKGIFPSVSRTAIVHDLAKNLQESFKITQHLSKP